MEFLNLTQVKTSRVSHLTQNYTASHLVQDIDIKCPTCGHRILIASHTYCPTLTIMREFHKLLSPVKGKVPMLLKFPLYAIHPCISSPISLISPKSSSFRLSASLTEWRLLRLRELLLAAAALRRSLISRLCTRSSSSSDGGGGRGCCLSEDIFEVRRSNGNKSTPLPLS